MDSTTAMPRLSKNPRRLRIVHMHALGEPEHDAVAPAIEPGTLPLVVLYIVYRVNQANAHDPRQA